VCVCHFINSTQPPSPEIFLFDDFGQFLERNSVSLNREYLEIGKFRLRVIGPCTSSSEIKKYICLIVGLGAVLEKKLDDQDRAPGHDERGGGLGSRPFFKNLMSPTPRRKWYLTMGRRAH